MTIREAINRVDNLKFNTYSDNDKVEWLSRLDNSVKNLIIDTHEGWESSSAFMGYGDTTDMDTVLLVPAPFDEIYLRWLEAQIDYHNGEFDKFNASIIMYNTAFDAYANFYNRNHMPRNRGSRFIF